MMNSYEEALAMLIERAMHGVDSVVEFSKAEIPDVIHQLLLWHFAESLIYFSIGIIIFVILFLYCKLIMINRWWPEYKRQMKGNYNDRTEFITFALPFTSALGTVILTVIGVFVIFANLDWLKIWIAPKLYLLEYGASLIR